MWLSGYPRPRALPWWPRPCRIEGAKNEETTKGSTSLLKAEKSRRFSAMALRPAPLQKGCSFCFLCTQLSDNIPNLSGRGPVWWVPQARRGENKPLQWSSVFWGLCLAPSHLQGSWMPQDLSESNLPGAFFWRIISEGL